MHGHMHGHMHGQAMSPSIVDAGVAFSV